MRGADIQKGLMAAARQGGWLVVHFKSVLVTGRGNRQYMATPFDGDAGFPDLVLAHARRRELVFLEVKGKGDQLRLGQRMWLEVLGFIATDAPMSVDVDVVNEKNYDAWVARLAKARP